MSADDTSDRRDHLKLYRATNLALERLAVEGDPEEALRVSFQAAAEGFRARKALLFVVEQQQPLRLKRSIAIGLTADQIEACERGESAPGVSSSVIRSVIAAKRTELIEDPRLHSVARSTTSLEGENYSVLCAPVCDGQGSVLAVLYFQHSGLADTYDESDRVWLEGYTTALGHAFGLHLDRQRQRRDLEELLSEVHSRPEGPELIGTSSQTQALRRELHETYIPSLDARHPDPILIVGERGTGKDLVARYIHAYSARREKPLVVVNCAEIGEELAASRFFGHKKGAFTSALSDEPGLFRSSHRGVLFVDEIAELHPRTQAALLRVLENHTVVPVGEVREVPVDVAVILATNSDLEQAVEKGTVRRDFHDRFRTQCIRLTPLRERPSDIAPLLDHFRSHHEARSHKRTLGFTQDALRALISYPWPGNAREVSRVCSLLVTQARPGALLDRALVARAYPEIVGQPPNPRAGPELWDELSLKELLSSYKRDVILSRLERHGGNLRAARESLRVDKTTMLRYLKELGITRRAKAQRQSP